METPHALKPTEEFTLDEVVGLVSKKKKSIFHVIYWNNISFFLLFNGKLLLHAVYRS